MKQCLFFGFSAVGVRLALSKTDYLNMSTVTQQLHINDIIRDVTLVSISRAPEYTYIAIVLAVSLPPLGVLALTLALHTARANKAERYCNAWMYSNLAFFVIQISLVCFIVIVIAASVTIGAHIRSPQVTSLLRNDDVAASSSTMSMVTAADSKYKNGFKSIDSSRTSDRAGGRPELPAGKHTH